MPCREEKKKEERGSDWKLLFYVTQPWVALLQRCMLRTDCMM